jgi:hypothetical protein
MERAESRFEAERTALADFYHRQVRKIFSGPRYLAYSTARPWHVYMVGDGNPKGPFMTITVQVMGPNSSRPETPVSSRRISNIHKKLIERMPKIKGLLLEPMVQSESEKFSSTTKIEVKIA